MLTQNNEEKVLRLFFDGPVKRLHVREVARRTNLSPPGAMKILKRLTNEGLLCEESNNVVVNYSGNYNNPVFTGLKRSSNLFLLYSCGLIMTLAEFYHTPECIVLFGSYAKGEDTDESDIDIAIITGMKKLPELHQYEEKLNRKISIHLISNVKKVDVNFINSLANGIVLYGYLDLI